jgi:hypothetical protein
VPQLAAAFAVYAFQVSRFRIQAFSGKLGTGNGKPESGSKLCLLHASWETSQGIEALKARCSKAQGGGREAAETLGLGTKNRSPPKELERVLKPLP